MMNICSPHFIVYAIGNGDLLTTRHHRWLTPGWMCNSALRLIYWKVKKERMRGHRARTPNTRKACTRIRRKQHYRRDQYYCAGILWCFLGDGISSARHWNGLRGHLWLYFVWMVCWIAKVRTESKSKKSRFRCLRAKALSSHRFWSLLFLSPRCSFVVAAATRIIRKLFLDHLYRRNCCFYFIETRNNVIMSR